MNTESSLRREFIISSNFLTSCPKIAIISCIGTAVLLYVLRVMWMNTESSLRREFITSSHFLTSCLWSTSTRIEAQPELSTRQQQHRQSSRCPASVILQDCKTERTYKYNSTATAQQYRYSSIVQFSSSISTVYSSTIHPRANSPTLTSDST